MVSVDSIEIDGVTYDVSYENEDDAPVLALTNGDEVLRLSPNTTDEELEAYTNPTQKGHEL